MLNANTSYRCEINDGSGKTLSYFVYINCGEQLYWSDGKTDYLVAYLYIKRGNRVSMDASAAGGNGEPLQYQWYKDGNPLNGANNAVLQLDSISDNDYGTYECKVTDGYNTISRSWIVQDDSILVQVDKISISPDGMTKIDGTATLKKAATTDANDFDVYLTGAWVVYDADGERLGGDAIEFRIDELASWTDGQWSGSTTRTEKEDSITITFSMELKAPYTLSEEQAKHYGDISNGEFVRYVPMAVMAWNGINGEGSKSAYAGFLVPSTDDFGVINKASDDQSVKVQGNLPPNSAVVLGDVNANITGDMRKALQSNEELIWLKDISLEVDGEKVDYNGELNISILVGEQYNGQTMKILHYKDNGQIEELSGMVTDGYLTFTTTSLSPFGVVASDSNSAVPVAETVSDVPKTGDNAMPVWMLVLIIAGAACIIAYTGIRQYHKSVK